MRKRSRASAIVMCRFWSVKAEKPNRPNSEIKNKSDYIWMILTLKNEIC
jgi:hypothetical protein